MVWVYDTGLAGAHDHTNPSTTTPSSVADVIYNLNAGSACDVGNCITGVTAIYVASSTHTHSQPNTGLEPDHIHPTDGVWAYFVKDIDKVIAWTTTTEGNHQHYIWIGSHAHDLDYGIREDSNTSPVMELKVNGETISDDYSGGQSDVIITGWINKGWNTVVLQPRESDYKRGRAQIDGVVQVFIESK